MTKPRGRPSVYKQEYPEQLIKLMSEGKLDIQVYALWDISKDTFYRWLNEYPELREAHNIGMVKCEAVYIDLAQQAMAKGDDKGFKYYISLMNNKFGWEKGAKGQETTINIGNMNVLNQMSRPDLLQHVNLLLEKNSELIPANLLETDDDSEET
jgi:hypothetical protein